MDQFLFFFQKCKLHATRLETVFAYINSVKMIYSATHLIIKKSLLSHVLQCHLTSNIDLRTTKIGKIVIFLVEYNQHDR